MTPSPAGPIDVHIHWCLFGRPPAEVVNELELLEKSGFDAVVVYPLPAMGAPPERAVHLIPGAYRDLTGIDVLRIANDDLDAWLAFLPLWNAKPRRLKVLSFLDIRAWDGETDLAPWWGTGHAGLKNILILDEDEAKMRMPSLRLVPGITREKYLNTHRETFALAARLKVPLMYHADLSAHYSFVEECLQTNPELRIAIPHFGFSRRRMAQFIGRYPSVMTDISSLRPFIDAEPEAYRAFILDHPDRVMMGSDAIACHDLRDMLGYVKCVRDLGLPEEAEAGVLHANARRFLGDALPRK